jgi:DHA2 family multidrug resistance protein-like MFS transporter
MGALGQAIMMTGLIALALLPNDPSLLNIAWRMSFCGIGFGLFNSPNNRTMMMAAPANRSGGASGMQATGRLLGQTTGTAVVALLFTVFTTQGGIPVSLSFAAGACVIAGLASLVRAAAPRG